MDIIAYARKRLHGATPRIVLAQGDDPRARDAAEQIERAGIAHITLLTDAHQDFVRLGTQERSALIALVRERRGLGEAEAKALLLHDTPHLAAAMVAAGQAEGYVAGNLGTTADTIRPALRLIGATGYASSYFLMVQGDRQVLFADCALNPEPTPEQLATIAVDTASSARVWGIDPRVAFLSFSTHGSASHARVEHVRTALGIARAREPSLALDGELQFDAAFDPDVASRKAPGSSVAGRANVFVFPDLDSGNIAYKVAQRMGGWRAIGPIFQGFKKPVNDLSRGCSVQDIGDVVAITAMQTKM